VNDRFCSLEFFSFVLVIGSISLKLSKFALSVPHMGDDTGIRRGILSVHNILHKLGGGTGCSSRLVASTFLKLPRQTYLNMNLQLLPLLLFS
jgi:hypothetical protein